MGVLELAGFALMAIWAWQAIFGSRAYDYDDNYQHSRESREGEWPEERDDGGGDGGLDLDLGL
jgi:hypothetical protein